jgi:hypothetical protein
MLRHALSLSQVMYLSPLARIENNSTYTFQCNEEEISVIMGMEEALSPWRYYLRLAKAMAPKLEPVPRCGPSTNSLGSDLFGQVKSIFLGGH